MERLDFATDKMTMYVLVEDQRMTGFFDGNSDCTAVFYHANLHKKINLPDGVYLYMLGRLQPCVCRDIGQTLASEWEFAMHN